MEMSQHKIKISSEPLNVKVKEYRVSIKRITSECCENVIGNKSNLEIF